MNLRENMKKAFEHQMPERIPHLSNDTYRLVDYIVERPINTDGYDGFGIHWIPCPQSLNITHPEIGVYPLSDISLWREQVKFPDIENTDWSSIKEQAKEFHERDSKMVCYVSLNGIFERTHLLMGFENALCSYIEETDLMEELCSAIADHKIRLHKKMYELVQPDIIIMHDDWGTKDNTFLPRRIFEKCIKYNTERVVKAAKETGYKYVVLHSCGKVESLVPDMLDIGFIGWDSCNTCNDLARIKREYKGRLVLLPGLDTGGVVADPNSTSEDLQREVRKKIDMLGKNGGLIIDATPAYSLNPGNEKIVLEEVLRYGAIYCASHS